MQYSQIEGFSDGFLSTTVVSDGCMCAQVTAEQETPVLAIATALSDLEGTPPDELNPPIGSTLDTTLINRFVEEGREGNVGGELEVMYRNHTITISPDGVITIPDS